MKPLPYGWWKSETFWVVLACLPFAALALFLWIRWLFY